MTEERRYGEDEVTEILDRATAPEYDLSQLPRRTGLTLAQIQEIGSEAGIAADRIERAAQSMAVAPVTPTPQPTLLGAPRSIERIIHLERALSDEEWSRLVADLRQTFGGEGLLEAHGTLRSWKHLGTTAHMEPTGNGYRVRLRSMNPDALPLFWSGVGSIAAAILFLVLITLNPEKDAAVIRGIAALFGIGGVGMMTIPRALLPRWGAQREAKLDGVAHRISLLSDSTEPSDPAPGTGESS